MSSKQYTYDVRVKASLDTSRVSGAGSSVRNNISNGLQDDTKKATAQFTDWNRGMARLHEQTMKQIIDQQSRANSSIVSDYIKLNKQIEPLAAKWADTHVQAFRKMNVQASEETKKIWTKTFSDKKISDAVFQFHQNNINNALRQASFANQAANSKYFSASGILGTGTNGVQNLINTQKKTPFEKQLVDSADDTGKKAGNAFIGSFRGAIIGMGTGMAIGAVLGVYRTIGQQIANALEEGMRFERSVKALDAVTVSASATKQELVDLKEIATKTPGLTFQDAVTGAQRLQAVGFAAQDAKGFLEGLAKQKLISNATNEDLERVIVNLQQIKSTGAVTQREIREILHAMPSMAEAMESAFGTTNAKRLEALNISASKFFRELQKELRDTPSIAGDTQDAFDKLTSSWMTAQEEFSKPVLPALKNFFEDLTVAIDSNSDAFASFGDQIGGVINKLDSLASSPMIKLLIAGGESQTTILSTAWRSLAFAGTFGVSEGVIAASDYNNSVKKDQIAQRDAANGTGISQENAKRLREIKTANQAWYSDELADSKKHHREMEAEIQRNAGFTKDAQRQMEKDLSDDKLKALDDLVKIEGDYWDKNIQDAGDNAEVRNKLINQKDKALKALTIENILEKAKIERDARQREYEEQKEHLDQMIQLQQSYYSAQNTIRMSEIGSRPTDTFSQAQAASRDRYEQQKTDLRNQLGVAEDEYIGKKLKGLASSEDYAKFKALELKINADLTALENSRKKEIRDEQKAYRDSFVSGGKLSGTTGNALTDSYIREFSSKYGINPNLILAQMSQESSFKPGAVSNKGATGLMQLMPGTFARMNVGTDIRDPRQNIEAGVKYMRFLLNMFGGNVDLALAGYNAGEGAVQKYGGIPPYKETKDYVARIKARFGGTNNLPNVEYGTFDYAANSASATQTFNDSFLESRLSALKTQGVAPTEEESAQMLEYVNRTKRRPAGLRDLTLPEFYSQYGNSAMSPGGRLQKKNKRLGQIAMDAAANRRALFGSEVAQAVTEQKADQENRLLDAQKESALLDAIDLKKEAQIDREKQLNALKKQGNDFLVRQENFQTEIEAAVVSQSIARKNEALDLDKELKLLEAQNPLEEKNLELKRQKNDLVRAQKETTRDIQVLEDQNNDKQFVAARRKLKLDQDELSLKRQLSDIEDEIANSGKNENYRLAVALAQQELDYKNRELDAVIDIETAKRDIARLDDFSANQAGAKILNHLARQRTLTEAIADAAIDIYDAFHELANSGIEKAAEKLGPFGDVVRGLGDYVTGSFLTKTAMPVLDKLFPGMGKSILTPAQKEDRKLELLEKIEENTRSLNASGSVSNLIRPRIVGAGGGGSTSSGGGGLLGNIGSMIFGAGGGGDLLHNSPLIFSLDGTAHGEAGPAGLSGSSSAGGIAPISAGGNIWQNLKNVFSTKEGGIFAPKHNILSSDPDSTSKTAGIMNGIGQIAAVAGGLIGGKWGGVLSMAGTGMSIGSMFGVPGAIIGAGVGALIGLFSGDPKKKQDKKENLPALQKGFSDAMSKLRSLAADKNAIRRDPTGVLQTAKDLREQISQGFGIQFLSKKYRKQAQSLIQQQLVQADQIISQIEKEGLIALAAGDRDQALIPEFGSGNAFDFTSFRRVNGVVPGNPAMGDVYPARLTGKEIVVNQPQQNKMRAVAGFDIFKYAGIPGYAAGYSDSSSSNSYSSSSDTHETGRKIPIYVSEVNVNGIIKTYLETDEAYRNQIKVIKKAKINREI